MMNGMNSELEGSPLRGISTRVALTTFALLLASPVTLLARSSRCPRSGSATRLSQRRHTPVRTQRRMVS
jgi:hypothetical protein